MATLRIGLAMGGGVSLGTFCGCALAQSLKLLIIYGRDRHGEPYDKVIVDVFSGASAGALSLAAMLRYLLYRTLEQENKATRALIEEFGADFHSLTPDAQANLIAAQVVQDTQEDLWTHEIKLENLLPDANKTDLRFKASLLDRGAVDGIAQRHLVNWHGQKIQFSGKQLLSDRVLYACTLANLTPMIADARAEFPGKEIGFIGLNDGLRSRTHRDVRVFDLNFTPQSDPKDDRFPDRWCLYHNGAAKKGWIGDLRKAETWAQIAATAIASGAFPVAFEPVALLRKAFEYGPKLWSASFGLPIPKTLSAFNGQDSHLFSFIDGGTFNNEPIREAFRLASFIDGHHREENPDEESERLILFVDPFVSEPVISCRVPILRRWLLEEPNKFGSLDGYDLRRASSLDRLLPHLGMIVATLNSEGRVNEADKIYQVRKRMELRDHIRRILDATLGTSAPRSELDFLISFCQEQLNHGDSDEIIPSGPASLAAELERVIHEQVEDRAATSVGSDFLPLQSHAENFLAEKRGEKNEEPGLWLRALCFLSVDLILGLEAKLSHAQLVAIAPFRNLHEATGPNGETIVHSTPINLPGGRLSGFAGFMSDEPDRLDYRAARYCAEEFLTKCDRIKKTTPPPSIDGLKLSEDEEKRFEADVRRGLDDLSRRVAGMVKQSGLIQILPLLDGMVTQLAADFVRRKVSAIDWKGKQQISVELRVAVPNERFELDGKGVGDQDCRPVEDSPGGPWVLITIGDYDSDLKTWSGGFVKNNRLDIDEDGTAFLPDKDFCEVELPTATQVLATHRSPNATFILEIAKADRGQVVPATRWKLIPGVSSLDSELLI